METVERRKTVDVWIEIEHWTEISEFELWGRFLLWIVWWITASFTFYINFRFIYYLLFYCKPTSIATFWLINNIICYGSIIIIVLLFNSDMYGRSPRKFSEFKKSVGWLNFASAFETVSTLTYYDFYVTVSPSMLDWMVWLRS